MNLLHNEIWTEIILYLPVRDLLNFNITCAYLHRIVKEYKITDDTYAHNITLTSCDQLINYNFTSYYINYSHIDNYSHNLLNKISKLNIITLPNNLDIGSLTNLRALMISLEMRKSDLDNITDESIISLTNLTRLEINNCEKVTNKSIMHLTRLNSLNIGSCHNITDKAISSNLRQLTVYGFFYPYQINNFEKFINLEELSLYYSAITDTSLSHLINLKFLKLNSCFNIETVKDLNNLTTLILIDCNINTIKHLSNLRMLKIKMCRKIKTISNLNSLTNLNIKECLSIKTISNLNNLMHLNIEDCRYIKKITNLNNLINLEMFLRSDVNSIDGLDNLNSLKSLIMTRCANFDNINQGLEKLKLQRCRITDAAITRLSKLTSLSLIYYRDSNYGKYDPWKELKDTLISKLTNLSELYIKGYNAITNTSIENLTNLTRLEIDRCEGISSNIKLPQLKIFKYDQVESDTEYDID